VKYGAFVQVTQPATGMRPVQQVVSDIEQAERLGYDSAWVMDHILVDRDGRRGTGHDPLVLLAYAAARTSRIELGPLVLGGPFRPVWQLGREGAALADASHGRFILGLGAGWHQPEFDAFDIPFDHLVGRLEEQVSVLKDLFEGKPVTYEGRYHRLKDAQILATAPPPPIWIAGKGPRMLRLTARCADGWNLAWGGPDPSWILDTLAALRRELEAAGRDPKTLTTSIGVSIAPGTPDAVIAQLAKDYEATGIDLLILSFNAHPGGEADPEGMARAAGVLGLG
jgi:alkanesulfonate monooxygenase SsuD/methylene tetrahydromethanopterin reductase-like flavin-dependent oxidoreductase (luciferase family)